MLLEATVGTGTIFVYFFIKKYLSFFGWGLGLYSANRVFLLIQAV
jgi:hypothetical protein